MSRQYLRTFQEFDFEDVQAHLLIAGDLKGDCASCRAIGIDHYSATQCPECGTAFKFLTSRRLESNPGERFQLVRRLRDKRPDLVFLDYTDFKSIQGKNKARDIFG
jgi:hypothetical protein